MEACPRKQKALSPWPHPTPVAYSLELNLVCVPNSSPCALVRHAAMEVLPFILTTTEDLEEGGPTWLA